MQKDFVVLQVDDIPIAGWLYMPDSEGKYPLVCACHGIPSGNTPDPGDGGYPALAETICREGFAVFIFNFRGTGESGGNIDILGWTRDLKSVIDYLYEQPRLDNSRMYLLGFSAGAATSIYVAAQDRRVSGVAACASPAHFGLFLDSPEPRSIVDRFRSIGAIRDDDFPPSLEGWLDDFRTVTPLDHVTEIAPRPLLLVHGSADETVPVDHARLLYEKAGDPKSLVILDGAGHRLRQDVRAVNVVLEWLKNLKPGNV